MIIGNIVCSEKMENKKFNLVSDLKEIKNTLPTLIIGWENTKNILGENNVSILKKEVTDNLYWTFNIKERKVDYEVDVETFEEVCYKTIEENINYVYIDVLHDSKRKIKKIFNKILSLPHITTYKNNNNMLYIFGENLVFGVDLNICEFIGIKKQKIIDKVKEITDVTLLQNEIFNKCKDLINNNREKIIPYIYYNGTNNN